MGAVLIGERVAPLWPLSHGSTFGGSPPACAAALAVIEVIQEENLPARAAALGEHLLARLGNIDAARIREIRGLGLMIGIELKEKVKPFLAALMERGVLALPAGATVLRLLPPLVIAQEDLDRVVDAIGAALTAL